jgi:alpha-glucosidase
MQNWRNSIVSAVAPEFLSPFPPEADVPTKVAMKMLAGAPVHKVVCHAVLDGKSRQIPMQRRREGVFDRWEAFVEASYEQVWRFSFQILADDGWSFVTRTGVQAFHPLEKDMHVVDTSLRLDDWVPSTTFYQIFPDRFRKGDPSVGVRSGEYTFDGHPVRVLPFDQIPPPYEEGHCLDFYNGDLQGIVDAIPHLKELGIGAVYLNPIFRARTNHRYDCIDFFHVDEHLGGDAALIHLSNALHTEGIALMLDVSINHSGIGHQWYRKALSDPESDEAAFYYVKPDGTFAYWEDVHTLPQLNYGNRKLRETMYLDESSVIRKFLKPPFSIDAWRFDVGVDTGRHGADQMSHEIWREVRQSVKATNPNAYIIGEAWEDASSYVQGDQWDSAMNYFGSGRLLRRWYGQQDTYLMSNWGHSDESGRPLSGMELADAISQHLYSIPDQLVHRQFNLIDSHDTMRLHNHQRLFDWDLYRGIIMMLYVMPGVPSIYYGDEVGLAGTIESNEGARYPMQWDTGKWNLRFFDLYKRLGKLRKQEPSLAYGNWRTEYTDEQTVVFSRTSYGSGLLMVLNRAPGIKQLQLDVEHLGLCKATEWESGELICVRSGTIVLELEAKESKILLYTSTC